MKKSLLILAVLLMSIVIPAFNLNSVAIPTQPSEMFVDPASIIDPSLVTGSNFSVTIMVSNVTNLFTWQVTMLFDPTILQCTNASYPLDNVFAGQTIVPVSPVIDNANGSVLFGASLLGTEVVNVTTGSLCELDFQVAGTGTSNLRLSETDSFLLDTDLNTITTTLRHGLFDNTPASFVASVFVSPSNVTNSSLFIGQDFSVTMMAANVTGLFTWQVTVRFDPTILQCTGASYPTVNVFAGHTIVPVSPVIDNTTGSVLFGASLIGDDTVNVTLGSLCEIDFQVAGIGTSDLRLSNTDTFLLNGDLAEIPATLTNGFFDNLGAPLIPPAIFVSPANITDSSLTVGSNFSVIIMAANVTDLFTWQVTLQFDPSILQCTNADYPVDNVFAGLTIVPVPPNIDNTTGSVLFGASLIADEVVNVTLGSLCEIDFQVVGTGTSDLVLSESDTFLLDFNLNSVPAVLTNGFFDNRAVAPVPSMFVSPAVTVDSSLTPGSLFNVTIMVTDVTQLFNWQVFLSFNASILQCTGASYPTDNVFAGHTIVPVSPVIDNTTGSVMFGASLIGDDSVNVTLGSLCEIDFQVAGTGTSDLVLSESDSFLLDTNLNTLAILITNGSFDNRGPPPTTPVITIQSPQNITYNMNSIPLSFTIDQTASWIGYSLDGQTNVTITENTTLSTLADGSHNVIVYANNTAGLMGASELVFFGVDTTPPTIVSVIQVPPTNSVAAMQAVNVNATVTDNYSGVMQVDLNYTTGNGTWILVPMTSVAADVYTGTIPGFALGTNVTYVIVAQDNVGNTITSQQQLGYTYSYPVIPEFQLIFLLPLFILGLLVAALTRYNFSSRTKRRKTQY